jgi:hypothetical protein
MKYICKKSSNQEMFAISLSSRSCYYANFKIDQSLFMTVRHIFEISEDDHPHNTQHRWSPTLAIINELQTSLLLLFSRV